MLSARAKCRMLPSGRAYGRLPIRARATTVSTPVKAVAEPDEAESPSQANRATIAKDIAAKLSITKAEALKYIDAALETIQESLQKGDDVHLSGFGAFKLRHRVARNGRNPSTGEPMVIPASNSAIFAISKGFKTAINGKEAEPVKKAEPVKVAKPVKEVKKAAKVEKSGKAVAGKK